MLYAIVCDILLICWLQCVASVPQHCIFWCFNISCNITAPNIPTVIVTPSYSGLRHQDCPLLELSLEVFLSFHRAE